MTIQLPRWGSRVRIPSSAPEREPLTSSNAVAPGGGFGSNPRRLRPGVWASPATSERASHEVPECGHAPSLSRSSLGPASTPPRRPKPDPSPSVRARLRCPGPKTAGGPPSVAADCQSRRTTFPPYKDRKEPGC
jgi:hypothetical protein